MIYLTLLFLILSFLLTYKRLNSQSIRFMYGIITGWTVSFFALILYLSKFNFYHNMFNSLFNFSPGTWNHLVLTNFNPVLLIRLLNGGTILFYYSLLCFAVSFTSTPKNWNHSKIYVIITAISLVQLVFFDPAFNVWLQKTSGNLPEHLAIGFNYAISGANLILSYMKYVYLAVTFALMIHYYWSYPKIRFIKQYVLYHIYILAFVATVHSMLFAWAPQNLAKATFIEGYYNYLQPPIVTQSVTLSILPYIVFTALALLTYIIYRYNSIEAYHKNHNMQINKSIDTASLGTRAFTHAFKNHLLAIGSEAEFLKEKHAGDEETEHSLNLMIESVAKALDSINHAAQQLGSIELNLQPLSLAVPIKEAVSRINTDNAGIQITVCTGEDDILAYMDEYHMSEVIYNLLKNAVEASSGKETGQIEIKTGVQKNWGVMSISDNGPGITPEHLDLIFSPFYTTKSSVTNWGIGLSFCHKIINGHDGKIAVESEPGQGTIFKIYLPIL